MGCAASKIEKEQRVVICKERKILMKQIVGLRMKFANAQSAYLKALKNVGVTLRQFTESELLETDSPSCDSELQVSSPPLSLPPSPPPPPSFSPDSRQSDASKEDKISLEENSNQEADNDLSGSSPPNGLPDDGEVVNPLIVNENSLQKGTESQEENPKASLKHPEHEEHSDELIDGNSSIIWNTRNDSNMSTTTWKRKTVNCIMKELDEYFLKAYGSGNDVAVLIDVSTGDILSQRFDEHKRKRSNSAKVLNVLTWSWSSRSLQHRQDLSDLCTPSEPCNPGANGITLDKLLAAEQNLYKFLKEDESVKLEHEKKLALLQKQDEENVDDSRSERIRSCIEELVTDISRLEHSITSTSSSILEIIDSELYPQLVAITSGSKNMWAQMYECHKVQHHISQQLNHLNEDVLTDLTSNYHRQATSQLEAEVNSWLISFSELVNSQKNYAETLSKWIKLTGSLQEDHRHSSYSPLIRRLCQEWYSACNNLPDKRVSGTIKEFLFGVRSLIQQQAEEESIGKKFTKLEKKLLKETISFDDTENKLRESHIENKRAKVESLTKQVEVEKNKCQNSIQVTRAMTLNKLKTHLPNVFMALMEFSSSYAQALEVIHIHGEPVIETNE